jgi:Ca2+-binding EF-hand superfamily protein
MNQFRTKLVDKAFSKLDKDGSGSVDINDIKGVYDASHHPDVKTGKKTEDDILLEFLETFETHHNTAS